MKTVVVTGSSRGIGYGLAEEFLKRGHQVVICGSTPDSTQKAVDALSEQYAPARLVGRAFNSTNPLSAQQVWDKAVASFGQVDIWINNSGVTNLRGTFWELEDAELKRVVETNLLGIMYASKTAVRNMLKQGFGEIYNMEGLGSNGNIQPGLILYGTTKSAITYFTKGLIRETKDTPVQVSLISPGMVVTDLLVNGLKNSERWEKSKRFLNILADKVETVSPFLVEGVLNNDKHGAHIEWLTRRKAAWRFATARFNKRELFEGVE